jgi:hypothetical protein
MAAHGSHASGTVGAISKCKKQPRRCNLRKRKGQDYVNDWVRNHVSGGLGDGIRSNDSFRCGAGHLSAEVPENHSVRQNRAELVDEYPQVVERQARRLMLR